MKKIVLAIDSFKGCLSSDDAENAANMGIMQVFPKCRVMKIPISDGGEGILHALSVHMDVRYIHLRAHDPLMRKIDVIYGISSNGTTAIIEMAQICGLSLLSISERNPMLTTSYGLGELISDAIRRKCKKFIIGIGGSATNDAGIGMLQALGCRFFDRDNNMLGVGGEVLKKIGRIEHEQFSEFIEGTSFIIANDVNNPLYGREGAAYMFAAQKGATQSMIQELDCGLINFSSIIVQIYGKDYSKCNGAGAAGGVGITFMAFFHAIFQSGIELLLDVIKFDNLIEGADLIITGEGSIDRQTLKGKAPFGILKHGMSKQVPVMAVAGNIRDRKLLEKEGFSAIYCINPKGVSIHQKLDPSFAYNRIKQTIKDTLSVKNII